VAPRLDAGEAELGEINVTPFIDVILVLLILFMVAAPLSTVDVPVNLPGSSVPAGERPHDALWLTVTQDRTLLIDDVPVPAQRLAAVLDARTGGKRAAAGIIPHPPEARMPVSPSQVGPGLCTRAVTGVTRGAGPWKASAPVPGRPRPPVPAISETGTNGGGCEASGPVARP
jgi:biopolymer transport protein ExbD